MLGGGGGVFSLQVELFQSVRGNVQVGSNNKISGVIVALTRVVSMKRRPVHFQI